MCNGETSTSSSNNDASHEMLAAKNGQVVNGKNKDKCKFPNPPTESSITSLPQHGSNGLGAVEQLLQVGRDLQALSVSMRRIYGHNDSNKKLMQNAFSLLAYADPWESPMGWQLSSSEREPVCAALNSAILQSIQLPRTPPLQVGINHAHLLLSQMARSGKRQYPTKSIFLNCISDVKQFHTNFSVHSFQVVKIIVILFSFQVWVLVPLLISTCKPMSNNITFFPQTTNNLSVVNRNLCNQGFLGVFKLLFLEKVKFMYVVVLIYTLYIHISSQVDSLLFNHDLCLFV